MTPYFSLIIGFVFLIKGAGFLVDGASAIARRFHVSDLVIGLTVVAFGTSTPELLVNIVASIKGNTEIAVGNVLGSNIANVLLILGVSAVIFPLAVSKSTVWKEIPFNLLAVVVLGLLANDKLLDGSNVSILSRIDGMILLSFFVIFLYYTGSIAQKIEGMEDLTPVKKTGIFTSLFLLILGLVGLIFGGNWIVTSASQIALKLGMSQSLIGLTIVAVGTSLPELATSAMAAYKKKCGYCRWKCCGLQYFQYPVCPGRQFGHKASAVSGKKQFGYSRRDWIDPIAFFHHVQRWKTHPGPVGRRSFYCVICRLYLFSHYIGIIGTRVMGVMKGLRTCPLKNDPEPERQTGSFWIPIFDEQRKVLLYCFIRSCSKRPEQFQ